MKPTLSDLGHPTECFVSLWSIHCLVYFIFLFFYGSQVLLVHIFYFWSYHVQSDRLDLFRHTLGELFLSVQWKKARWSDWCHCQWISNCLLWIMLLISMCRLIVKCPFHHFQYIFSWFIRNFIMNIACLTLVSPLNCLFLCEASIEWPWSSHWMLCFSVKPTMLHLPVLYGSKVLLVHIFYFWLYWCLLYAPLSQSDHLDLFRHTLREIFLSVRWKRARWSDCWPCQCSLDNVVDFYV